jgi:hypothetical protein
MTLDKGKVESGVGHAQRTPLKGQRFESLEDAQVYLDRWETHWADTRIHGTTKRQVATMFAEELPARLPLPIEPFRYYQYGERAVHLDGCVEVEAAYYGAPPGWIGGRIQVQWNAAHVRPSPVNCCASTYAKSAAVIESTMKIVPGGHRYRCNSSWTATEKLEGTLVSFARRYPPRPTGVWHTPLGENGQNEDRKCRRLSVVSRCALAPPHGGR